MALTSVFREIVFLSLLGSGLAVGLFIIKVLFRKKLSASWHYGIWFVLILRLIIPFTPSTPLNLFNLLPESPASIALPNQAQPPNQEGAQPAAQAPASIISVTPEPNPSEILPDHNSREQVVSGQGSLLGKYALNWNRLALVWLAGAVAGLLYLLIINVLLLFKLRKQPVCRDEHVLGILGKCRHSLSVAAEVAVIYGDKLQSPALFGLFRPKIIIAPELVAKLSPEELRYIFLHELSHLKRRDLPLNTLITLIQVIYWFNPLLIYALQRMKQDCEIACDATALAAVQPEEHKKYGHTVISLMELLAKPNSLPGTIGFAGKFPAKRIRMIASFPQTTLKWAVVTLVLSLLVGCSSLSNPLSPDLPNENQQNTGNAQNPASDSGQNGTDSPDPANGANEPPAEPANSAPVGEDANSVYQNAIYGFKLQLPPSWPSYTTVSGRWEGRDVESGLVAATGPQISLRDSRWSEANPRQDIPIMIFTLEQWDSLHKGGFHIGAAPIDPRELGRNGSYVFALPARYNFAFPEGYEEVEKTLADHPLQPIQPQQVNPEDDAALLELLNIRQLASAGKVPDNPFSAQASTIAAVEKAWGKPDSRDYVAAANGTYASYGSRQTVLGYNRQGQIFEIRSYDSSLHQITASDVKEAFMAPPVYYTEYNGQIIFGYNSGADFNLEFVFSPGNPELTLDHYNILYPKGTDAPGREW